MTHQFIIKEILARIRIYHDSDHLIKYTIRIINYVTYNKYESNRLNTMKK